MVPNKPVRILFLLLLISFFVWWGLVPALTRMDTDFPNYYTGGRIILDGGDLTRLYDDSWFQANMAALGIRQEGKFSPFPPPTALLFVPLSLMKPETALSLMTAINLMFLITGVILMSRISGKNNIDAGIILLLSGTGLSNCVRFGQLYIILSVLTLAGYYLYTRHRPVSAGVLLGLLIPVKYFPIVYVTYFSTRKRCKLTAAAV
ncbi:MAG: DUF2029 domain-containing protein, partial [Ignavibacteria bacterium]|nr:DUF2029 domain-containing protein [Ignavibacteria bacterium]